LGFWWSCTVLAYSFCISVLYSCYSFNICFVFDHWNFLFHLFHFAVVVFKSFFIWPK
jgi:hypothetical protein